MRVTFDLFSCFAIRTFRLPQKDRPLGDSMGLTEETRKGAGMPDFAPHSRDALTRGCLIFNYL